MLMRTKGDDSNGKVMTSLFCHFLTDTLLDAWCLIGDQSGCAVSEQDPTASVGDSFQKLLLEELQLLPKRKVSLCHMKHYVLSLKDLKYSKSLWGICQTTET